MTAVLALDLSLTSTGIAWCAPNHQCDQPTTKTLKSATTGCARLVDLRDRILDGANALHARLVVIEGYSMGTARQQSHAHALGELGGVIRVALHEAGIPYVELAPAVVKKLATGRGNAPKNEVLTAAVRRLDYDGSSTDEADARWLLEAAAQWYRLPWATRLPEAHLVGLGKVTWPTLEQDQREAVAS